MVIKKVKQKLPEYKLTKKDIHRLLNTATKVPSKAKQVHQETRKHIITAITAAFAFIIALTWRDAIRKIIDSFVAKLGITETIYAYEIILALIITAVCVLGIMVASKYSIKE
jgi:hypothetical protein